MGYAVVTVWASSLDQHFFCYVKRERTTPMVLDRIGRTSSAFLGQAPCSTLG
jgi:hypothetical protein